MSNTTKKRALNNRSAKSRQRRKVKYTAGITGLGGVNGGNSKKNKGVEGIEGGVQQNKPTPIDEDGMHFEWHTDFTDKDTGQHFASGYAAAIIGPGGFVGYKALDEHRRAKQEAQNKQTQKAAEEQKEQKPAPQSKEEQRQRLEKVAEVSKLWIDAEKNVLTYLDKHGTLEGYLPLDGRDGRDNDVITTVSRKGSLEEARNWLTKDIKKLQDTAEFAKKQLAALDEKPEEKPAPAAAPQKKPEDAVEKKEPPKPVEKPAPKEKTIKERKPVAPWKARTDAPTEEQKARMSHVKNILGKEWAKVYRRVADLKEAGKDKEARRVLLTAGSRYFNYAKEAYERWGDGDALSAFGQPRALKESEQTGENIAESVRERVNALLNQVWKEKPETVHKWANSRERKYDGLLAQEAAAKEAPVEEKTPEATVPDFDELDKQYDGLLASGALTENEADELAEIRDRAKRTQDPEDVKVLADKIADIDAKNNPPVFGEEEQPKEPETPAPAPVEDKQIEEQQEQQEPEAEPDAPVIGDEPQAQGDFSELNISSNDAGYDAGNQQFSVDAPNADTFEKNVLADEAAPDAPVVDMPTAPAAAPQGQRTDSVPIGDLKLDPERFQFKHDSKNARGYNASKYQGAIFNPDLAGAILVWRDPEDGNLYVVNGHHRYNLALENGYTGNIDVKYSPATTAKGAKQQGALQNIADNKGTGTDVAALIRDGFSKEDMLAQGVSPGNASFNKGVILSKLAPRLFKELEGGQNLDEDTALIIAETLADNEDKQVEFYEHYLRKIYENGETPKKDYVESLALSYSMAEGESKGTNLFGEEDVNYHEEVEARAKILQKILAELRKDERTFGRINKKNAELLAERNVLDGSLDSDAAKGIKETAKKTIGTIKEEAKFRGPLNDLLKESVRKWLDAGTDKERDAIIEDAVAKLKEYAAGLGRFGVYGDGGGRHPEQSGNLEGDTVHSDGELVQGDAPRLREESEEEGRLPDVPAGNGAGVSGVEEEVDAAGGLLAGGDTAGDEDGSGTGSGSEEEAVDAPVIEPEASAEPEPEPESAPTPAASPFGDNVVVGGVPEIGKRDEENKKEPAAPKTSDDAKKADGEKAIEDFRNGAISIDDLLKRNQDLGMEWHNVVAAGKLKSFNKFAKTDPACIDALNKYIDSTESPIDKASDFSRAIERRYEEWNEMRRKKKDKGDAAPVESSDAPIVEESAEESTPAPAPTNPTQTIQGSRYYDAAVEWIKNIWNSNREAGDALIDYVHENRDKDALEWHDGLREIADKYGVEFSDELDRIHGGNVDAPVVGVVGEPNSVVGAVVGENAETPEITAETPEEPSAEAAPDAPVVNETPENPTVKKWDFKGWHSPNGTATFNNGRFAIKFDGFPIKETRDALKRAGFKWDKESKEWYFDGTNWKGEDILPYPEDGDTREQNILKWAAREMYNSNLFDSDDIYRDAFGKLPHGEDESAEETDEEPDAPVIAPEPEASAATSEETPQQAPQEPQGAPAAEEPEQEPESAVARDEKAIRSDSDKRRKQSKKTASDVVSSHEGKDVVIHTDKTRGYTTSKFSDRRGATRIVGWKNVIENNRDLFNEAAKAFGEVDTPNASDEVKQAFAKYLNELKRFSVKPDEDRRKRAEAALADFGKKLIDERQERRIAKNRENNQALESLEIPDNFNNAEEAWKHLEETSQRAGGGRRRESQYDVLGSMAAVALYHGFVEDNEEAEKLFVDMTNHLLEAARLAKQYGLEDERVTQERKAALDDLKKNLAINHADEDKRYKESLLEEKRQYEALTARKTPEDVARKNPLGAKLGQMLRDHLYEMFGEDKIANNPTESVGRNRSIHGAFEDIRGIENADSPFETKRLFNYFINYNFPYGHDELKASIPSAEYEPDDITPQSHLLRVALNRALNPNETGYRKTMATSQDEAEKYFYLAQEEAVRKAWSDAVNLYEKRERFDNSHKRHGYWAGKEWLTGLSDEEKKERRKLTGDATRAVTKLTTLLQDALKREDEGNYEDGVSNPFNFEAEARAREENANPDDAPVLEEQEAEETPTGEETETVEETAEADAPVVTPEPQPQASAPEPVEEPKPEKPKKQRKAKGAISDEDAEDLNRRFQEATSKYKEGWQTDFNAAHENYDTATWDISTRELIAAPDEDRDAFRKEALKDPVIQSAFLEMLDAPMDVVKEDLLDEGREERDVEAVRKFQDVVQRRFQQWYKDRSCIKKRKPLPGQKSIDVYRQATTDAPVIDEPAPVEEGKKKEPELAEPVEDEQAKKERMYKHMLDVGAITQAEYDERMGLKEPDDAPIVDEPAPESSNDEYDDEEYDDEDEQYAGVPDWLVKKHKEIEKREEETRGAFNKKLREWIKTIDPRAALDVEITVRDNSLSNRKKYKKIKKIAQKYGEYNGDFSEFLEAALDMANELANSRGYLKEAGNRPESYSFEDFDYVELGDDGNFIPISKEERADSRRETEEILSRDVENPLSAKDLLKELSGLSVEEKAKKERELTDNMQKEFDEWYKKARQNPEFLKAISGKKERGASSLIKIADRIGIPTEDIKQKFEKYNESVGKLRHGVRIEQSEPVEEPKSEPEPAPVVSNEPPKTQPEETDEQRSAKQDYGKAFSEWYRKAVRVPGFVEATLGQTDPGAIFDIAERFNIPTDKIRAAQQRLLAAYGAEPPVESEPAKMEPQPAPEPAPEPEPTEEQEQATDAPVIDEDGVWESDEVKAAREAYEKIRDESRDLIKAGLQRWLTPYKTRRTFVADIMNAAKNGGSYPEFREIALRHGIPLDSELEEIQERVDRARDAYEESEMSIQLKDDDRARQEEIRRRKEANGEKRYRYARRSEDIYSVDAPVLTF